MIYLIGGTAKSGKTYLANKFLTEKNISNISTDYLMMAFSKVESLDIKVDTEDDRSVARKLEPFLKTIIEEMINNDIDYLIEGVHITPNLVNRLNQEYSDQISSYFLGYTDISMNNKKSDLINHKTRMKNCWYKHYSDDELNNLVIYLIEFSKELKKACEEVKLSYIEISDITTQAPHIIQCMLKENETLT